MIIYDITTVPSIIMFLKEQMLVNAESVKAHLKTNSHLTQMFDVLWLFGIEFDRSKKTYVKHFSWWRINYLIPREEAFSALEVRCIQWWNCMKMFFFTEIKNAPYKQ